MQYKPGDKLLGTGQVIDRVVGQGAAATVVITTDGQIRWEFQPRDSDVPSRLKPALATLSELSAFARLTFRPGHRDAVRDDLAEALWAAVETPKGDDVCHAFKGPRRRLETRWRRLATAAYLGGSFAVFLVSATVAYGVVLLKPDWQFYAAAFVGGLAGAWLSIAERVRRVRVDHMSPLWCWTFDGTVRILLGGLCGILMWTSVQLDLFLGIAKGRLEGALLTGAAAGVAERLVHSFLIDLGATARSSPPQPDRSRSQAPPETANEGNAF